MKRFSQRLSAAAGVAALIILLAKPVSGSDDDRELSSKIKQVQNIYNSQLGVKEQGNNSGKEVERYLRYVGLPKGNPWCAAFVCWVFGQAGVENPKTGWSPSLFPALKVIWKKSYELRVVSYEKIPGNIGMNHYNSSFAGSLLAPQPEPERKILTTAYRSQHTTRNTQPSRGDVFGIYFTEKGRIAHVGFLDEWDGKWVVTVEGNTNPSGSREGDGVYRKRRLVSSIYKVARYVPEEWRAGS